MFNYLEDISDENLKLIPQSAVKRAFFDSNDRRNAIWDMHISKSGRCFVALCAEQYVSEAVSLYEYKFEENCFELCFNFEDEVCRFHDAITPSKIHTSMCDMNDGRIIMTTHTTAQSPVHPYWHPEPFYNHTFEGYQGSNILIYDPDTRRLENKGVPVPHESIYGACYDPKHNCLYFTGYFRGHLYRFDVKTCLVTDYGKVTEFGSFRLHLGRDGNIYSASRSGNFYRVNTDTEQIEDLGIFFPKDYEPYSTLKHVQLDYLADAPDGGLYLKYIFGKNLYRYDYEKNILECVGDYLPETLETVDPYSAYGLICDENGVFWYAVCTCDEHFELNNAYLCRWDVLNGGKPQNMGLLGTPERSLTVCSEFAYRNGILYIADSNHHFDVPGVFTVDLRALEELDYSLSDGDLLYAKDILNYAHLREPEKYYKYSLEEYERQKKYNQRFFDYIEEYGDFLSKNSLAIKAKSVRAYPFWRELGCARSGVKSVRYNGDILIAELGNKKEKFCFRNNSSGFKPISDYTPRQKFPVIPDSESIPKGAGRAFKAKITAMAQIFDNKYLIGTEDGLLGVWDGKDVFSLGACPNTSGEIVDICYCESTRTAYGISGGRHDIAIVFSFDEKQGVRYLGRAHFNIDTGLYLSSELSCIAVNESGTKIAVGSDERMGVLYEIEI